jgi:hypothetical protein
MKKQIIFLTVTGPAILTNEFSGEHPLCWQLTVKSILSVTNNPAYCANRPPAATDPPLPLSAESIVRVCRKVRRRRNVFLPIKCDAMKGSITL